MNISNKCQMFLENIYLFKENRRICNFHLTFAYCLSVGLPVSKRQMPSGNTWHFTKTCWGIHTLHKKSSFLLRISSVNDTKSTGIYSYWKILGPKLHFLCSYICWTSYACHTRISNFRKRHIAHTNLPQFRRSFQIYVLKVQVQQGFYFTPKF